ncbi:MAG TPA: hypothetical protein P5204_05065 [Kiritimatiellia bacterium]|nr:hypothetical protein [Kiritimatiellia bacterium]
MGLLLAWGAAAVNFAGKIRSGEANGMVWLGFAGYGLLASVLAAGLAWLRRRRGDRVFLGTALGLALLVQFGAIWAADARWAWTGDAAIFRHYLNVLAENGYAPETLGDLSQHYDYRVWTRRALPFYYALRVAAADRFVPAVQAFQALLIALSLALAWRIARVLFGRRVAFWTVAFQLLMPFRAFICLELNHHVLGGFYFLVGLWVLAEWFRPERRLLQTAGLAATAAVLLPLMRLEGGIDVVWTGAVALVLLLAWIAGRQSAGQALRSAVFLLALPVLASAVAVDPVLARIDRADVHHHEVGAVGFMARGWSPETGGEYCGTYELVDYLTPRAEKKSMQIAILASQAYYNPRVLLASLLPIKLAKYFLLGYASGAEEMLAQNGAERARALAEGARTAFLLALLPLAIWGGWLLLPRLRRNRRLALVLPGALLAATYVLLGETSPRYSFYVQPLLFMLAALPLAANAARRRQWSRTAVRPGLAAAAALGGAGLATAAALAVARPALGRAALADLRTWSATALDAPATLAPFEMRLAPRVASGGTAWGPVELPPLAPLPQAIVFYVLPEGVPAAQLRAAALAIETGAGTQTNLLPARVRLEYPPAGLGELLFRSPAVLPRPLRIGYATYEFDEKTTE